MPASVEKTEQLDTLSEDFDFTIRCEDQANVPATERCLTVGSIPPCCGNGKLHFTERLRPFVDVQHLNHVASLVHQSDRSQPVADTVKAPYGSEVALVRQGARRPGRQRVTRIRRSSEQQRAGRDPFILVRAKSADAKNLDRV